MLVLAVAWIAAYPLSYAVLGLIAGRQRDRFRGPLLVWGLVVIPACVVLVALRPWLVWVGAVYVLLFTVNAGYARRRDERALSNDVVFIIECSAMVVVTWAVGLERLPAAADVPREVWILSLVCALVLTGSTLHVKSLIRERADRRFAHGSVAFALVSVGLSCFLAAWWGLPSGLWLVLAFVALAVRAVMVPGRSLRPGAIGMIELVGFVAVAGCSWLALPG